ncbi:MAG: hypothetical protein PHQ40_11085 [Anaerolineaceae bacterium]|nr:hypothetical protein [Anaerolineaceae bacterium]
MNTLKRFSIALVIAALVFVIGTKTVQAVWYVISEHSSAFTGSSLSDYSNSGCFSGNAYRAQQSGSNSYYTAYGYWAVSSGSSYWQAYGCNLTADLAAVIYYISDSAGELYSTTVNMNNWKGSWAPIGNFDYANTSGRVTLYNKCAIGYACDYRYIYWDATEYEP